MIREFVQSIDDREWQTQLFALLQKQTYNQVEVDLFELMCKVLDQNLFSQVDWARNTVFFKDLKVWLASSSQSLYPFPSTNQSKSVIRNQQTTQTAADSGRRRARNQFSSYRGQVCGMLCKPATTDGSDAGRISALNFDFIWRLTYLASKAEPVSQSVSQPAKRPRLSLSDATEVLLTHTNSSPPRAEKLRQRLSQGETERN